MANINKLNQTEQGKNQAQELVRQCRIELRQNVGSWSRLCRVSGGKIGYHWLQRFAAGEIITPKVDTILELAKYLGIRVEFKKGQHYNRFED